jgi:hypothetical protein
MAEELVPSEDRGSPEPAVMPNLSLTEDRSGPEQVDPPVDAGNLESTEPSNLPSPMTELADLEARVRRLEEEYAALKDTRQLEERLVHKVATRLRRKSVTQIQESPDRKPDRDRPAAEVIEEPASILPEVPIPTPAARPFTPAPTAVVASAAWPSGVPVAVVAPVPSATAPVATLVAGNLPAPVKRRLDWLRRSQLFLEILNDFRAMLRLGVDPRYRLTWLGRLVPLLFLVCLFLGDVYPISWVFPWTWLTFGWIIHRAVVLILGFIAFKVLLAEVHRYREQVADAPGNRASPS